MVKKLRSLPGQSEQTQTNGGKLGNRFRLPLQLMCFFCKKKTLLDEIVFVSVI